MLTKDFKIQIFLIVLAIVGIICGYFVGKNTGYKNGYEHGYAHALESITPVEKPKEDTVQTAVAIKTETETHVKPKTSEKQADVVVNTAPPVIHASVNGKKYDFKPKSEYLDTTVKTTGVINVKVPERKYAFGIGYGKDRKVSYMLKVPVKNAIGVWVAGSNKNNVMGGISISF